MDTKGARRRRGYSPHRPEVHGCLPSPAKSGTASQSPRVPGPGQVPLEWPSPALLTKGAMAKAPCGLGPADLSPESRLVARWLPGRPGRRMAETGRGALVGWAPSQALSARSEAGTAGGKRARTAPPF